MDVQTFIQRLDAEQRQQFADMLKTSPAYLSQLGTGHRKASPKLARKIVLASQELLPDGDCHLTLSGVRPDIWPPDEAA